MEGGIYLVTFQDRAQASGDGLERAEGVCSVPHPTEKYFAVADTVDLQFDFFSSTAVFGLALSLDWKSSGAWSGIAEISVLSGGTIRYSNQITTFTYGRVFRCVGSEEQMGRLPGWVHFPPQPQRLDPGANTPG